MMKSNLLLTMLFLLSVVRTDDEIFYGMIKRDTSDKLFNFLPITRDQNQPKACNASWAFALTTAMSAQFNFKLPEGSTKTQVALSPQMLINCATEEASCDYNKNFDITKGLQQLVDVGVVEEGCNNYYADDTQDCSSLNKCKDCENGEDIHHKTICHPKDYHNYKLAAWGKITTEETDPNARELALYTLMLEALNHKGPLVCQIKHSKNLFKHRTNKYVKYQEKSKGPSDYSSWVAVMGMKSFEFDDINKKAWVLQTSFGANVGMNGVVYIDADYNINYLNIMDNCYWMEVDTKVELVKNTTSDASFTNLLSKKFVKKTGMDVGTKNLNQGLKKHPSLFQMAFNEGIDLTAETNPVDWRNMFGRNTLTYVKNQHIPTYCGSCWAQAAASVLADRLNIKRIQENKAYPSYVFSVQAIINCREGGTCFGGDSSLMFEKLRNWKMPVESCRTYESHNPDNYTCDAQSVCRVVSKSETTPVTKFNGVKVSAWGRVRGAAAMKAELLNGPIVCDFEVTDAFLQYKSTGEGEKVNIYDEEKDYLELNHAVSVVGWGEQDGVQYWVVRNSWGSEWGYDGFFYMKMGSNVLGIESDCSWAKPVLEEFE